MAGFKGWEIAVLKRLGAPVTKENLRYMRAWQRAEGGSASFNPLNTTQEWDGASSYNSVGVRNYRSARDGIAATAKTLTNGYYDGIVNLLRSGKATAEQLATAESKTPWGTGAGILRVLGSGPVKTPSYDGVGGGQASPAGTAVNGLSQQAFKSAAAAQLLQNSANLAAGKQPDFSGVLSLATMKKQLDEQSAASPMGPSPGQAPLPSGKGGKGIKELFYDPLGGIKDGNEIGAIGNHGDHVHFAAYNARDQIRAIKMAQRLGLHVGENLYTGDAPEPGVHVQNSNHYQTFAGKYGGRQVSGAVDISGSAAAMARFYKWAKMYYR